MFTRTELPPQGGAGQGGAEGCRETRVATDRRAFDIRCCLDRLKEQLAPPPPPFSRFCHLLQRQVTSAVLDENGLCYAPGRHSNTLCPPASAPMLLLDSVS
ncbi:uncharacterized [Tachysurus ichikawai]